MDFNSKNDEFLCNVYVRRWCVICNLWERLVEKFKSYYSWCIPNFDCGLWVLMPAGRIKIKGTDCYAEQDTYEWKRFLWIWVCLKSFDYGIWNGKRVLSRLRYNHPSISYVAVFMKNGHPVDFSMYYLVVSMNFNCMFPSFNSSKNISLDSQNVSCISKFDALSNGAEIV